MSRSPMMQQFVDEMSLAQFGRTLTEAHQQHICVRCGQPALNFEDERSADEYNISGFCQKCQLETFGEPGD